MEKKHIDLRTLVANILIYTSLITPLVVATGGAIFPFVFPKAIFFEIVVGALAAALVPLICLRAEFRTRSRYFYLITVYAIALVLSAVFAFNPERAFWSNFERMTGVVYIVITMVYSFLVASFYSVFPHKIKNFLSYSVLVSVVVSVCALYQKIDPTFLMNQSDRLSGTFGNPIYLGGFAAQFLLIAAYFAYSNRRTTLGKWYALAAVVNLLAVYFSGTRSALLGLGVAVVLIGVYVSRRLWNTAYRNYVIGVWSVLIIATLTIFIVPIIRPGAYDAIPPLARITKLSLVNTVSTRVIAWNIAITGFTERPLLGWGSENFYYVFNSHYNPASFRFGLYETWFDHAHNAVFDVLVTQGLVGLVLYLGQYAILLWMCYKTGTTENEKLLSVVLASVFILHFTHNIFVFDHPGSYVEFYALAAIVVARHVFHQRAQAVSTPITASAAHIVNPTLTGNAGASWIAGLLTLAPLLLTAYIVIPPMRQNYLDYAAQRSAQVDLRLAKVYFQRAIDINGPYTADALIDSGRVAQKIPIRLPSGKNFLEVPEMKDYYLFSIGNLNRLLSEVEPASTLGALMLAQLYSNAAELDDKQALKEADATFAYAAKLSPRRQQIIFSWARIKMMLNDMSGAIDMLVDAVNSEPEAALAHWYLALLYGDKQPQQAVKHLNKLVEMDYPIDSPQNRLLSALVYARGERYEQAAQLFELALREPGGSTWQAQMAHEAEKVFLKTNQIDLVKKTRATFPQFFPRNK